ncbi:hypothetical protein TNCV_4101931 [Trichonephila clavipes]|nr:hypothetical protein TNCV_4101931 [Trichonephila clavipes]
MMLPQTIRPPRAQWSFSKMSESHYLLLSYLHMRTTTTFRIVVQTESRILTEKNPHPYVLSQRKVFSSPF